MAEYGHYAHPNCYFSLITTAMASPTAQPKSYSMVSPFQKQTITTSPTVCIGDQMAGSMAAAALQRPAQLESREHPTPSASCFAAACGASIRGAGSSKSLRT